MKKTTSFLIFVFFLILIASNAAHAEKISVRFSYNYNSINKGDINTWINSSNSLWKERQKTNGGLLEGQFISPSYGPTFEMELRIPIISGFALNLAGNQISSKREGNISFQANGGDQNETHFISNEIKALPLRIGLSYSFPVYPNFTVYINAGRHIIFVRYKTKENYESVFSKQGKEDIYLYKKENTYNSEGLGFYASLALEYNLLKFIGLVIEAEKIWSNVNGFKGPYSYSYRDPYKYPNGQSESGKASLYFYESKDNSLDQYYSVLTGHKNKPVNSDIRNVRHGELNFSGFSLKIGFRFKF